MLPLPIARRSACGSQDGRTGRVVVWWLVALGLLGDTSRSVPFRPMAPLEIEIYRIGRSEVAVASRNKNRQSLN